MREIATLDLLLSLHFIVRNLSLVVFCSSLYLWNKLQETLLNTQKQGERSVDCSFVEKESNILGCECLCSLHSPSSAVTFVIHGVHFELTAHNYASCGLVTFIKCCSPSVWLHFLSVPQRLHHEGSADHRMICYRFWQQGVGLQRLPPLNAA